MTGHVDGPRLVDVTDHHRVNHSLLAPLEGWLLARLAPRVARRVRADACTLAGVVGAVLCGLGYAVSSRSRFLVVLATLGVVLHWLGDSLDGTVARLRGEGRPRYGFYLDHFADAVCQIVMFVGLGLSPFVDLRVAVLSLLAFQSLTLLVLLRTAVLGEFRLSFGRIGPTEAHAALVVLGVVIAVLGPSDLGPAAPGLSGYDPPVAAFGLLAIFHFLRLGLRDVLTLRADGDHRAG